MIVPEYSEKEKYKKDLLFYEIMKYPIPQNRQYFLSDQKYIWLLPIPSKIFSRNEEDPRFQEYKNTIIKYTRLYKTIPWVQSIYIANSLSFNKLKEDSDIDLFIVTKKKCLRRARFWSALYFFFLWIKRNGLNKRKKFCLSFYVTEDHQNIYDICLPQTDIYLAYRLAHLVPIYHEKESSQTIYTQNTRIQAILPNLPKQQNIFLDLPIIHGMTSHKKFREKRIQGRIGFVVEFLIKTLRLPILIFKVKKLKKMWWGIVINDNMLKFHEDKRKIISLLYKTRKAR